MRISDSEWDLVGLVEYVLIFRIPNFENSEVLSTIMFVVLKRILEASTMCLGRTRWIYVVTEN